MPISGTVETGMYGLKIIQVKICGSIPNSEDSNIRGKQHNASVM